jgi:CRISPR-associated protein Csd1
MLRELVEAAERFTEEGALDPAAYKSKSLNWIIEVETDGQAVVEGPYRKGEITKSMPDRQRSGKPGPTNMKPYLLADDARYALGIAAAGDESVTEQLHQGFVRLVEEAYTQTGETDGDLAAILGFLNRPTPAELRAAIAPSDFVSFRRPRAPFPFERDAVQQFWSSYLGSELEADVNAICGVCGRDARILRVLPNEVVVMGQKCQITSFNQSAFRSYGKPQSTNAPLCQACGSSAIRALTYLIGARRHRAVISRDDTKSRNQPLRNQLAVFWLRRAHRQESGDAENDVEDGLAALMGDDYEYQPVAPPPSEAQIRALVTLPWTGEEDAVRLDENSFYLAVLSANKGRLVVREWIALSLCELRDNLVRFLRAIRIVDPFGTSPRLLPLPMLTEALGGECAAHVRALLRTAYLGAPPAQGPLMAALRVASHPRSLRVFWDRSQRAETLRLQGSLHAAMAVLKLAVTYDIEEAERMEGLDLGYREAPYLCGRFLALIEEAQRRASRGRVNTTVVDRYYTAAATAPAATFSVLTRLLETAYLPKVRKENRGYGELQRTIQEVMNGIQAREGGIRRALNLEEQAEFALGFYQQRAALAPKSGAASNQSSVQQTGEAL